MKSFSYFSFCIHSDMKRKGLAEKLYLLSCSLQEDQSCMVALDGLNEEKFEWQQIF